MEYKLIDHRWKGGNSDHLNVIEYDDNDGMDTFENLVNEALLEGWVPHGSPSFMQRKTSKGLVVTTVVQAMTRIREDKPTAPAETNTRKSSRLNQKDNGQKEK